MQPFKGNATHETRQLIRRAPKISTSNSSLKRTPAPTSACANAISTAGGWPGGSPTSKSAAPCESKNPNSMQPSAPGGSVELGGRLRNKAGRTNHLNHSTCAPGFWLSGVTLPPWRSACTPCRLGYVSFMTSLPCIGKTLLAAVVVLSLAVYSPPWR